jgi:hypothetical protein
MMYLLARQGATRFFLFVLLAVVALATAVEDVSNDNNKTSGAGNNNNNSSQPPADTGNNNDDDGAFPKEELQDPEYYRHRQPPWGISSYGNVNRNHSNYLAAGGFVLDIVRPGWSWHSQRQEQLVAPFCYDVAPNALSICYSGDVADNCHSVLQGTPAYGDRFCLTDQPHTIIGPVCWNGTCHGAETRQTCATAVNNGWYIGARSEHVVAAGLMEGLDVGWCVVPGDDHTLFGPACYGPTCYTAELIEACMKLNGTNFADRFCLLHDKSYTVVGPVCTPTIGPIEQASECYADETAQVCLEMGGTSVGGIFCILQGDNYSVLGPFCSTSLYASELYANCVTAEEGKSACHALSGRSIGNGTFCILDDRDYHLLGPLCYDGGGCTLFDSGSASGSSEGSCEENFGGLSVGGFFCIIKGDYTIVGPSSYGGIGFSGDNILAKNVDQNTVHDVLGSWYVLNGTYSVYGPTCWGSSCHHGNCVEAGGSLIRVPSLFLHPASISTVEA